MKINNVISIKRLVGIVISIIFFSSLICFYSFAYDPDWYNFEGFDVIHEEKNERDGNGEISDKLGTGGRPYQQNLKRMRAYEQGMKFLLGTSPITPTGDAVDPSKLSPLNMYTGVTSGTLGTIQDVSGKTNWTLNMYNTSCPMVFADELEYPFSTLNFPKCYSTNQLFLWFSAKNTMKHFAGAATTWTTCSNSHDHENPPDDCAGRTISWHNQSTKQIKCSLPPETLIINYWLALDKKISSGTAYDSGFGNFMMPGGVNFKSGSLFIDSDYKTQTGWGMDWKMSWRPFVDGEVTDMDMIGRQDLYNAAVAPHWGQTANDTTGAINVNVSGFGWSGQTTLKEYQHVMCYETLRSVTQPVFALLTSTKGPEVSQDSFTDAEGGGYTEDDGVLDENGDPYIGD